MGYSSEKIRSENEKLEECNLNSNLSTQLKNKAFSRISDERQRQLHDETMKCGIQSANISICNRRKK